MEQEKREQLRRIRETPCPGCGSLLHFVVDPDGAGEELRYCDGCGVNFAVDAESGAAQIVRLEAECGFYFHPDDRP